MVKFLILCAVFFLLYLGFNTIGEFDSSVKFSAFDYEIDTTVFTFAALFLIAQVVLMIIFRGIFLIFDLPSIIRENLHKRKLRKTNRKVKKT